MRVHLALKWCAIAGTAFLASFVVQTRQTKKAIEAQLAEARAQAASLRAELQRTEETKAPTITKLQSEAQSTKAVAKGPDATAFPPRTRPPGLRDFARDNPQIWNDFVTSKRAELGRLYLPLLQRLNLAPGQRERFKDILAAGIARGSDISAAADVQGLAYDDPAIVKLREQSEMQQKTELAQLLGPVGFQEFDAFQRALPVRGFVDGLATEVAFSAPLSEQQANALERALAETNPAYRAGKSADPAAVDWQAVDRRASELLSPSQLVVWQAGLAHNKFGGSRLAQELKKVYDRARERERNVNSGSR